MAKCYYNGVLLPEIPADVLESFPYVWINSQANGFIVAAYPWYYSSGRMNIPVSAENRKYVLSSDGETWSLSNTYTDTGGYTVDSMPTWSSHDIPNGSATSTTIYVYGSDPVPENEAKPKELEYSTVVDIYPGSGKIYYSVDDQTINYVVPVRKYSTYTVTMTEVGNRLRAVYCNVDPATITADISATDIVQNPSFSVGYTFTYLAQADGWMVVYVSNAGERPKISIVTNGAGGDGAPLYDRKYLIRMGGILYTITSSGLTALSETEVTADLFRTYGFDEVPTGNLFMEGMVDPELLYWHDSEDELPTLIATVKGAPPLPQMFTSEPMDLTHESIAGINYAAVDASEDVRFAISFDGGTTWKAHDGAAWFEVSDTAPGMLPSTMNAITAEQWAEVVVLDSYQLRFWLPNVTAYVKSVVMHYINP